MPRTIVGLGEALFDLFPTRKVLGGAPLNFAVHAHQLVHTGGGSGVVASRIGEDPLGRELLVEVAERGMVRDFIQIDPDRTTGSVSVSLRDGEPQFDITNNVAWDALEFDEQLEQLAEDCDAVCFGTLAQRSETTRTTIDRFLATAATAIRLFDVNLRQHYYDAEVIDQSCRAATVVKLNEHELPVVAEELKLGELAEDASPSDMDSITTSLLANYQLDLLALTRGARGTVLYTPSDRLEQPPLDYKPNADADSVGAGDACAAGLIVGLLHGWPLDETLSLANHAGAYVASVAGATPKLPKDLVEYCL